MSNRAGRCEFHPNLRNLSALQYDWQPSMNQLKGPMRARSTSSSEKLVTFGDSIMPFLWSMLPIFSDSCRQEIVHFQQNSIRHGLWRAMN